MKLSSTLLIAALLISRPPALAAGPPPAGNVEILSGSDSTSVEVNLRPLEPLAPAMRAILAFYAMRGNGGCPAGEWTAGNKRYEMRCPLTTALDLGFQCSDAQLAMVKTWFKEGIPALRLSRGDAARIGRSGDFTEACNDTPYTATHQSIWSSLRVRWQPKGLVTITGEGAWTSGPDAGSGSFTTVTTYRILADRVQVVSHHEDSHRD